MAVYLNGIKLDWAVLKLKQSADGKFYPLDPTDIPNQIITNVRIAPVEYSLQAKFNISTENRKELLATIKEIRLKKEVVTIVTDDKIIENLVMLDFNEDTDKYNVAFSVDLVQFQTAKITSTGNPKASEKTQISDTTTVGTQGVTNSDAKGGYLV